MTRTVSTAPIANVPIDDIEIGLRRRDKLGRVQRLAASIAEHGLVHPILLRGTLLVAGHRRLEACRLLKWRTIPARQVERLSDDDLRAIELDENVQREALSDYAASKARLAQIRQAEADSKAKAVLVDSTKTSKGGRPPKRKVARQKIAEQTGISDKGQRNIEKHVEIAERFPFMQRGGWLQHHVLEAGIVLDRFSDKHRSAAAALVDQDAIPPKTAIAILDNLEKISAPDRDEIFRLARSADSHERQIALNRAAAVPPPVDPALLLLGTAEETLRRAAKTCRTTEFQPRVKALATEAAELLTDFQESNANDRRSPPTL
jgi:ParB-like nuclease domain